MNLKMKAHQVQRLHCHSVRVGNAQAKRILLWYVLARVSDQVRWLEQRVVRDGAVQLDKRVPQLDSQVEPKVERVGQQLKFES